MINFVLTGSKNYSGVQEQILGSIIKHLPTDVWRDSVEEYVEGCLNFTLFIDKEADVLMSHGAADKNYHWRKIDGDKTRRMNHERRRTDLLVPGSWLRNKILISHWLNFPKEHVHVVGWPRLDTLLEMARRLPEPSGSIRRRKKVLWAPSHDYARRGEDMVSLSSYPEFSQYVKPLGERYDVEISLHPRNRKDKRPTDKPLIEADIVIADFGTMVYEAIALGKQVIFPSWLIREPILRYLKHSAEYEIFRSGYGVHAESFEHLCQLIDEEAPMPAESRLFFDSYLPPDLNGRSGEIIADLLIKLASVKTRELHEEYR